MARVTRLASGVARETLASARPLLWLIVGFLLTQAYVRGVVFPSDLLAPLPLYPPQAIILSALLLTPTRRWPILLAVYYAAHVADRLIFSPTPPLYSLVIQVVNVVEPLVGAALFRHFVRPPELFDTLRAFGIYIACFTAADLMGSLWGASFRAIFTGAPFWPAWQGWFVGTFLASLILTPTLVLWISADWRYLRAQLTRRWVEASTLMVSLLAVSRAVFGMRAVGPDLAPQLLYLPVPFLLWGAVRFGPLGLTAALSLFTVLAIAGVANQLGPFVGYSVVAASFHLQLFLLGIGVPLLCLAILVEERTRTQQRLAHSEERYRAVVQNLPSGAVFLFGPDLRHVFVDGQGLPELGLSREAVEGKTPAEAFPPSLSSALEPRYRAALAGRQESFELTHGDHVYHAQALPIVEAGPATGMLLMQDITQQRRAELRGAEQERERLAREFHDSVSQTLFAATVTADALPQLLDTDPQAAQIALAALRRMADSARSEMRSLLFELRPEALTRAPLHELLRILDVTIATKAGVRIDEQVDTTPVLPPEVQLAFYRIAQEALTNIAHHANASLIEVRLHVGSAAPDGTTDLSLEIADDGGGFDLGAVPRGRLGLSSMRERADSVGATLVLMSRTGEGTRITVRWIGKLPQDSDQPSFSPGMTPDGGA